MSASNPTKPDEDSLDSLEGFVIPWWLLESDDGFDNKEGAGPSTAWERLLIYVLIVIVGIPIAAFLMAQSLFTWLREPGEPFRQARALRRHRAYCQTQRCRDEERRWYEEWEIEKVERRRKRAESGQYEI